MPSPQCRAGRSPPLKPPPPLANEPSPSYLWRAQNAFGCWRTAMLWSVNIGSIAGTAVKIHITFLMFLVWIFAAGWASGGAEAAMASLIFMVLLFACVLAHEFGHIFTALLVKDALPK